MKKLLVLLPGLLAACARPVPVAPLAYTLGPAWQGARGVWFYPRQNFDLSETGLATVIGAHGPYMADHARYDPDALVAAHQTLQLPAIVRVTNLQTGRRIMVRVDDRGPASPARVIALSPRAAALLGIAPGSVAQVRIREDVVASMALAEALHHQPRALAAPVGAVQAASLAPLPGSAVAGGPSLPIGHMRADSTPRTALPPLRLPEHVVQGPPQPGQLMIAAGTFSSDLPARMRQAALAGLDARISRYRIGGGTHYAVIAGPYPSVSQADAALDRAIAAGVTDARIVVR